MKQGGEYFTNYYNWFSLIFQFVDTFVDELRWEETECSVHAGAVSDLDLVVVVSRIDRSGVRRSMV